jgi:hypothetical protein
VPAVAAVALIASVAALVLLWTWIDSLPFADADKRATAHLEAIKVASTIAIGGGGLFALYLAARRQRTQELELDVRRVELAQRDRVQVHAEQVAADARQDAAERRVTELYTKASDQLGSDKAPVRLAGLYALERLGQGNVEHRKTVIDVICAYLRMPYTPPDESGQDTAGHQELQVRKTAQRMIDNHLCARREDDRWTEITDVDLQGATLVDFRLADCRVASINLNHAVLSGESVFRGTTFLLAFMQDTTFSGPVDFRSADFVRDAWFSYSTFGEGPRFSAGPYFRDTHFGGHVSFRGTVFTRGVHLAGVKFSGSADFTDARCPLGAEAIDLTDAVVDDLSPPSPLTGGEPTAWPPGWVVEPRAEGGGLVWNGLER